MHFAVDYGHLEVVKSILASSRQVDLEMRNCMNMTPFNTCRNPDIFEILIAYTSKVTKSILSQSRGTSDTKNPHEEKRSTYEGRLIVRNSDVIPNTSRVDQVERFLSLR